jgi:zinc protease
MKTWMKKKANLLIIFLFGVSVQGNSMEKPVTVEHKLGNGLKVVVREDHRAPVAVAQVWYKVGSAYEPTGITGISHALEHMMFQGTPTLPGDGFAILISQYGGNNNAFTAEDYTAYYEELDTSNLPVSFKAEADRMQNLVLSGDAFAKEIQVVIEERRMRTDDNPQNTTWERFVAVANTMGPYHHPIIGWQNDLDHMTIDDLKDWYKKWYVPNNAVLVVVGDVKAQDIIALAEQYFGPIPARDTPKEKPFKAVTALGEKRIKVQLPAELPYIIWGYDVPTLNTTKDEKEIYALVLISAILDGGESARFSRELIRGSQVAVQLGTNYDLFKKFPTQFILAGIPAEGHTVKELETKLMEQLENLKAELVPGTELDRVKTQLLAQEIFEKDSMSDQATMLGMLESVGLSWKVADTFVEKIKAVTPQDIQNAAKKYFNAKSLTVAELVPEKMKHQG